jgi:hypothetical protein
MVLGVLVYLTSILHYYRIDNRYFGVIDLRAFKKRYVHRFETSISILCRVNPGITNLIHYCIFLFLLYIAYPILFPSSSSHDKIKK